MRTAHGGQVTCVTFQTANPMIFASRGFDNTIKVPWPTRVESRLSALLRVSHGVVPNMPCGRVFAQVWNLAKFSAPIATLLDVETLAPTANCVFSPNGKLVVRRSHVDPSGRSAAVLWHGVSFGSYSVCFCPRLLRVVVVCLCGNAACRLPVPRCTTKRRPMVSLKSSMSKPLVRPVLTALRTVCFTCLSCPATAPCVSRGIPRSTTSPWAVAIASPVCCTTRQSARRAASCHRSGRQSGVCGSVS